MMKTMENHPTRVVQRKVLGASILLFSLLGCSGSGIFGPASTSSGSASTATATPPAQTSSSSVTSPPQPTPTTPAPAAATPPVLPFDEAILSAANTLFSKAQLPAGGAAPTATHNLVIDPLIDGLSGAQSVATRSMAERIVELVHTKYPQYAVKPFSPTEVAKSPIVLIGTFTSINKQGQSVGKREAYRVCLALADLASGKIVSKGLAWTQMNGVDITPTTFFRDSPAWAPDAATEGYVKTCQGTKAGDPIKPAYVDRILAAALINEAIEAYNARRYRESLELYSSALRTPAGEQLRVYNGIYLNEWKLGNRKSATEAFGKVVDYGLANKRLGVKFLFKPGSTAFWPDPRVSAPYAIWLQTIATRTAKSLGCLEITGHTSPTGPEVLNERLSVLRAEFIKKRLETQAPSIGKRTIANGVGSRENMVGTGKDDASDALDRRVEFKVYSC